MAYDYARGWQAVLHDPRLNNPLTAPPTALRPPGAQQTWTVDLTMTIDHILGFTASCTASRGPFDAVHIMAHGNRALVQIGATSITSTNCTQFTKLKGKTRWIVFWSCLVGSEDESGHFPFGHPEYFGTRISRMTGAHVVVARQNQVYSWPGGTIDFGDWDGPVDIFHPDDTVDVYQEPNPFRAVPKLDLETLIFR